MSMRKLILTLLIGSIGGSGRAEVEIPTAPEWQVTLRVLDEGGFPVANADVYASYYSPPPPNAPEAGLPKTGQTDTNGLAILTAHSGPSVVCGADKTGYYANGGLTFDFKNKVGDQWQPWNPTGTLLLKKIGKQVPMYARWVDSEPPAFKKTGRPPIVFNKTMGYDLMAGDGGSPPTRRHTTINALTSTS